MFIPKTRFLKKIAVISAFIVVFLMLTQSNLVFLGNSNANVGEHSAIGYLSDSSTSSNSTRQGIALSSETIPPFSSDRKDTLHGSLSTFPQSVQYQPYTDVSSNQTARFNLTNSGPTGISYGVMNSTLNISIYDSGSLIHSAEITGDMTNYVVILGNDAYGYFNFNISGEAYVLVKNVGSDTGQFAFNCYSYYITNDTASLITYPAQFGLPIVPGNIPAGQVTGIYALVTVPEFGKPEPFSTQINGGFSNDSGSVWFAQVGLATLEYEGIASQSVYPVWETFSNIYGSIGGIDTNRPLVPGEIYNLSIEIVENSTWEFAVNGQPITYNGFSGYYNATGSMNGMNFGLETEPHSGPTVNMSNEMLIPTMFHVRVNGAWTEPGSASFQGIGENWYNGNTTGANGISLWGIAGHIQNSSIPNDTLQFQDNLSAAVESAVPISGAYQDPIYGTFYVSPKDYGNHSPYLTVKNKTLEIKSGDEPEIISLIAYASPSDKIIQDDNYVLGPYQNLSFHYSSTHLLVAAANLSYNLIYEYIVSETPRQYNVTFIESGLPPGASWSVTLNGTVQTSTSDEITFVEPNGPYSFFIENVSGFSVSTSAGEVTVNDSNQVVQILFNESYRIVFAETGLPNGTQWSVLLNIGSKGSDNSTLTFLVPNGTYLFQIEVPEGYDLTQYGNGSHKFGQNGYTVKANGSGNVSVYGSNIDIGISFKPSSTRQPFYTLPIFVLITIAIVVAAIAGAILTMRYRKKQ